MATKLDETQRTKTLVNAAITVVAVVGIVVLLQFFIGPRLFGRIDLTDKKYHTLSEASKAAATALDEVTVRVYISDPLPDSIKLGNGQTLPLRGVAQAFRDKLEEYQAYSDGRMSLVYVTDDVRDQAEKAKLQLFTSEQAKIEKGRLELAEYALGATFHYRNVKEVLPLALNPETYEFDITQILLRLKDKYEKSQAMKQMLDKGKAIFDAVEKCNQAVQDATKGSDGVVEDEGLKGLIQAAEQAGEELAKLKAAKDKFSGLCGDMNNLVSKDGAELRAKKNTYLDIFLDGVSEFQRTYEVMVQRLEAGEQEAMTALEVQNLLGVLFAEVDRDHENLVNSPGQKRIGFVCGHGEFCPFVSNTPVVKKELAAIMGQQNPLVQQIIEQASQIEQNINQINYSINQNLFMRRGFEITRVDLNDAVGSDIESLVMFGPTEAMSDRELYHLDQFALSGKPIVVFAKSWDVSLLNIKAPDDLGEEETFDYTAIVETASNVSKLLEHYGVKVNTDLVAEPKNHEVIVVSVTTQRGRLRWQSQQAFPYPLLPSFDDLSDDNVLMQNLKNLALPYSSTVEFTEAMQGKEGAEVLVRTSSEAAIIGENDIQAVSILPPETIKSLGAIKGRGPAPVAVLLNAPAESYFKGKEIPPIPAAEGEDAAEKPKEDKDLRRKESGNVRILVIGSNLGLESLNATDVLKGFDIAGMAGGNMDIIGQIRGYGAKLQNWQLRIQQVAELLQANIRFLFNVLDWSIANEALVEVRSKAFEPRPLEQVDEGEQRTVTYANIFGVPALFLAFGGIRYFISRRRRRTLKV